MNHTFSGYEKLKTVGKGSFGIATLYRRINDNKHVVMKEIYTLDMDQEEKKQSSNEVQIISSLNHPNIISYLGSFEKEGSLVIIMEYADGGNLTQLINKKKNKSDTFTEKGILNVFSQICNALSYMHGCKILHRDLKSANIFLTTSGVIKVGDFGISKMLNTRTQAQTVVGTPYYLSPEMCEGSDYNEKSDIWSVGCILYELACLKKPFEAPTLPVLVKKIVSCEFDEIPKMYSEKLASLVDVILQRNPRKRPSASQIYETIIPNIASNLNINNINLQSSNISQKPSFSGERSILYEMRGFGENQELIPIELPHKKIIDFSVSLTHKIVVTSDYLVYAWGEDNHGQLALGDTNSYRKYPICINYLRGKQIVKAAAGVGFSIFLNKQGILFSCGDGRNGCLGHGNFNNVLYPSIINSLLRANVINVCCGDNHVVALTSDGQVITWGSSKDCQLGQGHNMQCRCSPLTISLNKYTKIKEIFTGPNCTMALTDAGQLMVCGNNEYNKLGVKDTKFVKEFTFLKNIPGEIIRISASQYHTALVLQNGNLITMGRNTEGQLGKGNCMPFSLPQLIKIDSKIIMVACGPQYTTVTDDVNTIWFWGTYDNYPEKHGSSNNSHNASYKTLLVKNGNEETNTTTCVKYCKSLLALYSSKENIKAGNIIYLGGIKSSNNSLFILAHTTTPPPQKEYSSYNEHSYTFISQGTNQNYLASTRTFIPNTPQLK